MRVFALFGMFFVSLFLRAPWPLKILISIPLFPIVVTVAILRMRRNRRAQSPVHRLGEDVLNKRLLLQTAEADRSYKEAEAFQSKVRALTSKPDWVTLDTLLTRCDQSRMALKDDTRLTPMALGALWDDIAGTAGIGEEPPVAIDGEALPDSVIEPLLEAAEDAPDSYMRAAIAAGMSMRLGWARRGSAWSDMTEEDALQAMQALFDTAGGLLAEFDPDECNSPLLAGLAYENIAGAGTDLRGLNRAFSLRMRLDPDDPDALAQHGWYLLPRWYGDYEELDEAARRRCADTRKRKGMTDYAQTYAIAVACDEGAMMMVDLVLYREGLIDMIDHSRDPEAVVNTVLNTLHAVSLPRVGPGGGREQKELRDRRETFRDLFDEVARARLTRILPHRWDEGLDAARHSLALTYQDQILAGETVCIGDEAA